MKAAILQLIEKKDKKIEVSLSLKPLVHFLTDKIKKESKAKVNFFEYLLNHINGLQLKDYIIELNDVQKFEETFELIYLTLTPPVANENEQVWALSVPFTPVLFYGTNALFHLLADDEGNIKKEVMKNEDEHAKNKVHDNFLYQFILEKLYGYKLHQPPEMIHTMFDPQKGINRYFKVEFNASFVDVQYHDELPVIDFEKMQLSVLGSQSIVDHLKEVIPLDNFSFEGFSIVSIHENTQAYSLESIKNIIVNLTPGQKVYTDIGHTLKTMIGNQDLDVYLLPILKVNNELVIDYEDKADNNMDDMCEKYAVPESMFLDAIKKYAENPVTIFKKSLDDETDDTLMFVQLQKMGFKSIALFPVFHQKNIVGILQLISSKPGALHESVIPIIEATIPLLEQLLQNSIDNFNNAIETVVKDKFTSLQPAVEWKFNAAAWKFISEKQLNKNVQIDAIEFEDVYPLYGAIDIRNSSVERNNALRTDLQFQLKHLKIVLNELKNNYPLSIIDEMLYKADNYATQLKTYLTADSEYELTNFLEKDVIPFLEHFQDSNPASKELITGFIFMTTEAGEGFTARKGLETSLQLLNTSISNTLDEMNVEIQRVYPCYFEKFRSDGVEYDIYIGQSISPGKPFHHLYLKNLRLWQLNSMALIANLTHSLLPHMAIPLETTQLIFVHSGTIDISFRNDEHRFDVEGAYNIRYEMIKKRIDKVNIRHSNERLTQPGKIALVYFQQKDVEEYISFIQYLQTQGLLEQDVEYLDLEELQGVSGLKAIRVGVKYSRKEKPVAKKLSESLN